MAKRITIYLSDPALQIVGDGDSFSGEINKAIDRYGEICRRLQVEDQFTAAEIDALRAVANGWLAEPAATIAGGLAIEVEEAGENEIEAFGVDRAALIAKLRALDFAHEVALIDSLERFWRRVRQQQR